MSEEPLASNVLGKYRLIAELGRGGMAEVFLAMVHGPAGFNKLMVIKRLRPHLAEEQEFLQMFLDEARLAAKLSHPNIVQTMEVGESQGQFFISMEYLEGQPLNRILRRCEDVGLPTVVRILCDSLSGLHHAHELTDYDGTRLHVVHRDATPHNIFVTYDGQVKVVDFGIAKAAISVAETRTGVLKGKVSYMAPEQARGDFVDRRADVFSIGCCLWEAITGQRVWKGKSDIQVLNAIMGKDSTIPSPRTLAPDVDPRLEAITMRALAFDPDDRYQTALDLRRDLDGYLEACGDRASVAEGARLIAARFEHEREKLRALIDRQTRSAADLPTGEYARMALPRLPGPPPSLASGGSTTSSEGPSDETPTTINSGSSSAPRSTGAAMLLGSDGGSANRMPAILALAAVGVIGIAAAVAFWPNREMPTPAEPVATAEPKAEREVTPAATEPTAEPAIESVELSVTARPRDAKVLLDGVELGTAPLKRDFPRDDEEHLLAIEADGYETLEKRIRLDKSIGLDLVLKRSVVFYPRPQPTPKPEEKSAQTEPPPPPPPPSSALDKKTKGGKAREIDGDNPYK
jgi:eukaryotic-like serine/threonine-protein kinase